MSIAGIRAGQAFVEFLIKDDQLDSGLAKVGNKLTNFGKWGLAASGPIVAGFTAAVATFASVGGELDDLHRRTGLSVESLSELSFVAKQSGTDMGVVEKGIKELQKNGIDPLKFDEIAADIAAIPDHTARAQRAIDVFGAKAGVALLPMLEDLQEGRERARRLGLVMSAEDVAAADRLGDAFLASKDQMVALMAQIGAAIAGPLTEFLLWSQEIVARAIEWVHENPRLVQTIAAVAGAVAIASTALITFGTIMTIITLHPIVAALALIAGAVVGIATYFGLATDGAKEFQKKLDGIQQPTNLQTSAIHQQAAALQLRLQGVQAGMSPAAVVSPDTSAAAARVANAFNDSALEYLRGILGATQGLYDLARLNKGGVKAAAL